MTGKTLSTKEKITKAKNTFEQKEWREACVLFEGLVLELPNYADGFYYLGLSYHHLSQFSKAQIAFEKALEINPGYTEAALNLAVLYNDLGMYEKAEVICEQIMGNQPQNTNLTQLARGKLANLHGQLAELYSYLGEDTSAIREYKQAIRLAEKFSDIRVKLANVLRDNKNFIEAKEQYQIAIQQNRNYIDAYIQLGVCEYLDDKVQQAILCWKKAMELDPHSPRAQMYLRLVSGYLN